MTTDHEALAALAEQMCQIFTVGPRGTSWRIDDVSVRAVQAAVPGLIAEVERLRAQRDAALRQRDLYLGSESIAVNNARSALRGMGARCWMLRQVARESDTRLALATERENAVRALPLPPNPFDGEDMQRAYSLGSLDTRDATIRALDGAES